MKPIKIDLKDLDRASMLDDETARTEAIEALITSAHVLARQNPAHAFLLLLSTLSDFAAKSNVRLDLLEIAVLDLQMHLDDTAREVASALPQVLTGDPDWQAKALARMTAPRVITDSRQFDWLAARQAAEQAARFAHDAGYVAPEDVGAHRNYAQLVCEQMERIAKALHITSSKSKEPPP